MFPDRVNTEFIQVVSRNEINMRVWERGSGETLACGTGACATTVVGIMNGYLDNVVHCHLPGGILKVEWNGNKNVRRDKGNKTKKWR